MPGNRGKKKMNRGGGGDKLKLKRGGVGTKKKRGTAKGCGAATRGKGYNK